jgi:hypothetical protein
MSSQKIHCPNCATEISIDDVLTRQLETQIKQELAQEAKLKQQELAQKEADLQKRLEALEAGRQNLAQIVTQKVAQKLEEQKSEIEKQARAQALEASGQELLNLRELLAQKDAKLDKLIKDQVELFKQKQQFEDDKKTFELEMLRKQDEIKDQLSQEIQAQTASKYQLQLAELNKKLQDAQKANQEMERKLTQGSQQTQGEVLELELEELLRREFPYDQINPVAKGVNGADITQEVYDKSGHNCGTIVWETKRTKNWTEGWISKLKDDQRHQKAEVAVIVSSVLPKDVKNFGLKDGVWIADFVAVVGLATALRAGLINVAALKAASVGKNEKMEILYRYLSGVEFKQKIEAIVESFTQMKTDLDKERRAFIKIWESREKQINRVIENTVGMYGDLEGLMGSSLPKIEMLELPDPDATEQNLLL